MTDLSGEYGRHARERLEHDVIGWFATVRPDGRPDVVPVWFLWENDEILIYSRPEQQKLRNIAGNPQVALVLDDTRGGGDVVRISGRAEHIPGHALATEFPAYVSKYAGRIVNMGSNPDEFARAYSAAIRVHPERISR